MIPVIKTHSLCKDYHLGNERIHVLKDISFNVEKNEYVAIMGQSGAGKSTLLNIIGCLDVPTRGEYHFEGRDVAAFSAGQLAEVRNREIGFVFQSFNLLPKLTIAANVELPLIYGNVPVRERKIRVQEVLEHLGIWDRHTHKPNEISGGQKQRVAIARALIKKPALILADEPTGNLDSTTTAEIMTLLDNLNKEGNTIIVITHEEDVATHAHRLIRLKDGQIVV